MAVHPQKQRPALLLRVGARLCALPLSEVVETLRPLPIEPIAGAPSFVLGVSVLRGAPVPVVDLARLLGGSPAAAPSRLVSLRAGNRRVAIAVDAVVGTTNLDPALLAEVPPLLGPESAVEELGALDEKLLRVLRAGRILPEETWRALAQGESP